MDENDRVRMARPEESQDQGHTIVGGRPAGRTNTGGSVPRAMEALVKKAAVDAAFLEELVARRSSIADACGIELDPTERAMLDRIPEAQLRATVAGVRVPEIQRSVLAGSPATAIVALLAQLTFAPVAARSDPQVASQETNGSPADQADEARCGGIRPRLPPDAEGGIRPDLPEPTLLPPGGARPDIPVSRGMTLDIPPDVPALDPSPPPSASPSASPGQPADAQLAAGLRKRLGTLSIKSDLSGLPLSHALVALGQEAGVPIRLKASGLVERFKPLKRRTDGLPFKRVLRAILDEMAPHQPRRLDVLAREIVVTVGPTVPGTRPPATSSPPPISNRLRGSRPDIPGPDPGRGRDDTGGGDR